MTTFLTAENAEEFLDQIPKVIIECKDRYEKSVQTVCIEILCA